MPITGPDILLYEKKERIVTITMNRPERMNALSLDLIERLEEAWRQFQFDDDAWVAILTGAGDKSFCSGFDLIDQAERDARGEGFPELSTFWPMEVSKPRIAAINGYAIAGGWLMAQCCDIRLAAEQAGMGIAESRWNLPAWWLAPLTRQLNLAHALEIVLWGDRRITAQRAYEMGWVSRVVPREKLMEEAMSWAERMLYLGPRAVRNFKEMLYRCYYMPREVGLDYAKQLENNLKGMEDTVEGPKAFTEKRKPQFKNR